MLSLMLNDHIFEVVIHKGEHELTFEGSESKIQSHELRITSVSYNHHAICTPPRKFVNGTPLCTKKQPLDVRVYTNKKFKIFSPVESDFDLIIGLINRKSNVNHIFAMKLKKLNNKRAVNQTTTESCS